MGGLGRTHLVDVLALELGDEGVQALVVSLNANGVEDLLDIVGGGGSVATEAEEEVSCEVLHFDGVGCSVDGLVSLQTTGKEREELHATHVL